MLLPLLDIVRGISHESVVRQTERLRTAAEEHRTDIVVLDASNNRIKN